MWWQGHWPTVGLRSLHCVQIIHFVEDFHAAVPGFSAVALVPPKAFGVRVFRVVRGCQNAGFFTAKYAKYTKMLCFEFR